MALPLPMVPQRDTCIWPLTPDGFYSTKSGYQFLQREEESSAGMASTVPSLPSTAWKRLWKAPALPRCRETGWRACLGALPFCEVLHARGMDLDPICPRCQAASETVHHALLFCPMVKATWFASSLGLRLQQEQVFRDFFLQFLQVADDEALGSFLEILYAVWCSRNDLVFNDTAATVDQAGHGGFGFITRNSRGEVLAAACSYYGPVLSPTTAEALSMRWSMTMAADLGFRKVVLETDCSLLVDAWKRNGGCSYLDSIVRDCNVFLSIFDVFALLFVRRTGNCAADCLASLSLSQGDCVWIEEVPPQLIGIVQTDVSASATHISS
ncbi:uncharacterized protein LOC130737093 [Lotus japonicus]|uniref:uncharacterized protein LOC130737093 n=1 Tax=Lotus japonicus TaxID=34305 RepID=UPI002584A511|nr:uncharacterized protein LOC130737093 [Lotus japonicus]